MSDETKALAPGVYISRDLAERAKKLGIAATVRDDYAPNTWIVVSTDKPAPTQFLYDVEVRPPSPEACARFARQIEAMIGRPITQADVDSLRNMGRSAKGNE